jgi:hypothetical protein
MNPQDRVKLVADSSPALRLIKDQMKDPSRVVGLDYNFYPGYGGAVGLEQVDGADPLLNKFYRSMMDASGVALQFSSANIGLVDEHLAGDLPFFEMLNSRYFLGHPGTPADQIPSLKRLASLDLDIYEATRAWPRAFFTNQIQPYETEQQFVELVRKADGNPFAAVRPADTSDQVASLRATTAAAPAVVPATDYALTSNTTSFRVNAPAPGVAVLTEAYVENDLDLRVNGKPAEYFRVNSAFRGVALNAAGEYEISYRYWPRHLTMSLWVAGISLVTLLLWLFFASFPSSREVS